MLETCRTDCTSCAMQSPAWLTSVAPAWTCWVLSLMSALISRAALAALHRLAFLQAVGVAVEVGVVVGEFLARVELVDGDAAAALAEEQAGDATVFHRQHRRADGRHDVDGVVAARTVGAGVGVGVGELVGGDALHRQRQAPRCQPGRVLG